MPHTKRRKIKVFLIRMVKKKRYKYFELSGNKTWNWLRCLYNISYIQSILTDLQRSKTDVDML